MRTDSPAAGSPSGEPNPATWSDLAPWLASRGADPEFFWIDDDPITADAQVRQAHSDLIAVLIIETLPEIALGDLLPMLPGGVDLIPDPDLPTRAANWLLSSSTFTTDRIRPVTAAEILDSRGMGTGSVTPLLSKLVALSVEAAGRPDTGPDDPVAALLDDLAIIARWHVVAGQRRTPLLAGLPDHAPTVVHDARRRLDRLTGDDLALTGDQPEGVAAQLDTRIGELAERDRVVFAERRLTRPRIRLESLGERFGVSRERVRQYEARALDELYDWMENSTEAQFMLAAALRAIGTVRPLDELLATLPAIGETVPVTGAPLWRVLTGIGVPFQIDDGWAATPTLDAARETTRTILEEQADRYGVVRLDALDAVTGAAGTATPSWYADWAGAAGYAVYRGHILTRTSSVEDYAAAILRIHAAPMTPEELVAEFHVERSVRSLVNQMTGDDRFQRVSRTQWGLREWGGDGYESIRVAIARRLTESGGSAPLADLVDALAVAYDVKAASIVAYAAAPPFRTEAGIVTAAADAAAPRKSPAQTRSLYRVGDAWKLRVAVNREHLRGSGAPLPVAMATALGLAHGEVRHLDSADGEQSVSWTALQPTIGSIRRFVTTLGLDESAEMLLVFTDDGRFEVEPVRAATDPMHDALARIGAPATDDAAVALAALAVAAGLPPDTAAAAVAEAYAARGETDIAALLTGTDRP
ncbi:sigma factor-like helix-turn-helix DNA-binding protein [Gordonia sp. (in: high G+C Gram-positive bacteria)]|uniref:sigma factor-like helix-turn-helix DNA-binding protein n=1 Tax=Gordonia sp. (in: high G+C Gram-positive bacteria) TaxID=84139 RepID=UPI00261C227A|nr:sigma factor-like helix-turn-helix DNA-binding protein [Gordonia sp. (in: high G+C Gram-positive bacteria)]